MNIDPLFALARTARPDLAPAEAERLAIGWRQNFQEVFLELAVVAEEFLIKCDTHGEKWACEQLIGWFVAGGPAAPLNKFLVEEIKLLHRLREIIAAGQFDSEAFRSYLTELLAIATYTD